MCYQLWYIIPAFTEACFGQSVVKTPRYGLDEGWSLFFALLLGLDREPIRLIWTHKSSLGLPALAGVYFYSAKMVSFTPIFIYMGYYLYDHFHAQTFRILLGKS